MIIFSSILTSIDVLISKLYQKQNNSSILFGGLKFNFFVGLFSSIIFLIINKFHIEFTLFSCISAVVMTAIAVIYIIIGFKILDCGKAAHYTFFRMTGAMIVPYIWGLCFLNEKFSFMRIVGLILIITAVFLVNSDRSNVNLKNILMYITVFFLAGCVSVISKQHSISVNAVSPLGYVILTSFVKIILCGMLLLFFRKKENSKLTTSEKNIFAPVYCALSAIITGIAYMIQLICAKDMPATVIYPVITGGTIIFSAIFARLAFKEKLSKKDITAITICFVGTCMFL